jgi:hypothetical protein
MLRWTNDGKNKLIALEFFAIGKAIGSIYFLGCQGWRLF